MRGFLTVHSCSMCRVPKAVWIAWLQWPCAQGMLPTRAFVKVDPVLVGEGPNYVSALQQEQPQRTLHLQHLHPSRALRACREGLTSFCLAHSCSGAQLPSLNSISH